MLRVLGCGCRPHGACDCRLQAQPMTNIISTQLGVTAEAAYSVEGSHAHDLHAAC